MGGINAVRAFNIPADDIGRASDFYRKVFGWGARAIPGSGGDYTSLIMPSNGAGQGMDGPMAGGLYRRGTNGLGQVFLEVTVASIDRSMKEVLSAGGRLVREKRPMLDFAFFAVVQDTEGNLIGLWEDMPDTD
jgi:uncharacterized protein